MWIKAIFVFSVVVLVYPATARAGDSECPEAPEDEAESRKLAGKYFGEGEQLFKDKSFGEALRSFVCSLRIVEHENTVFNIDQVVMSAEDLETAYQLLMEYITEYPGRETTPDVKNIVTEVAKVLGKEAEFEEPPLEDDSAEDLLGLEIEEEAPPNSKETENEKEKKKRILKIVGLSAIGTGGASLLTAIILQGASAAAKKDAKNATSYDSFLDHKDKRDNLQAGATAMFITAVVLGGAGAGLLYLARDEEEKPSTVEVSILPGPGGLTVKGMF
ncbi:MAG: hypothetical protein GY854_03605 [Deltaproteobacteria bacterium]|nr:hypothetical protein [Deltaproteobacteria bacterium]